MSVLIGFKTGILPIHQQIERLGSGYPMQRECLPHNVILLQPRAGQCPLARAENSRMYYTPV